MDLPAGAETPLKTCVACLSRGNGPDRPLGPCREARVPWICQAGAPDPPCGAKNVSGRLFVENGPGPGQGGGPFRGVLAKTPGFRVSPL